MTTESLLIVLGVLIAIAAVSTALWLRARNRAAKKPEALPSEAPPSIDEARRRAIDEAPPRAPGEKQEPLTAPSVTVKVTDKPHAAVPAIVRAQERAELRGGLAKTRSGFVSKLSKLFAGRAKVDADLLGHLEEVLFTADIGTRTAERLITDLRTELSTADLKDDQVVWDFMKRASAKLLEMDSRPLSFDEHKPCVVLIIGVNGAGKTTTIGKLAAQQVAAGKKVLLAAGDTFRAAATEQLDIWAQRTGCPIVKGKEGGDPSSVIFEAARRGKEEGFDIVICDTAGRLHTKVDLMEELQKVRRVTAKACEGAPHETLLVLDATSGQNAISQAQLFKQAMDITGIVLTKLDGTAKGGVILGICDELKVPVRFIGIGERIEDLRTFVAEDFVEALYDRQGVDADVAA